MKVAIMQPYFFPYAGYFRLFSEADLFVIYDCVQFPRRGRVHRNQVFFDSKLEWVTLPIVKCSQETKICDLSFAENADVWSSSIIKKLKSVSNHNEEDNNFDWSLLQLKGPVVEYLIDTLLWNCEALGITSKIIRSSSLKINSEFKSQERIIEICRAVGAGSYINLSGGISLYDEGAFKSAGIKLSFLPQFEGGYESMLGRILKEPSMVIRNEVLLL